MTSFTPFGDLGGSSYFPCFGVNLDEVIHRVAKHEEVTRRYSVQHAYNRSRVSYVVEYIYNALRGYRLNKICERITYLMCFILLLEFIIIVIRSL